MLGRDSHIQSMEDLDCGVRGQTLKTEKQCVASSSESVDQTLKHSSPLSKTKFSGCIKVKLSSSTGKTDQKAQVEVECDNPSLVLDRMLNSLISRFPLTSVVSVEKINQSLEHCSDAHITGVSNIAVTSLSGNNTINFTPNGSYFPSKGIYLDTENIIEKEVQHTFNKTENNVVSDNSRTERWKSSQEAKEDKNSFADCMKEDIHGTYLTTKKYIDLPQKNTNLPSLLPLFRGTQSSSSSSVGKSSHMNLCHDSKNRGSPRLSTRSISSLAPSQSFTSSPTPSELSSPSLTPSSARLDTSRKSTFSCLPQSTSFFSSLFSSSKPKSEKIYSPESAVLSSPRSMSSKLSSHIPSPRPPFFQSIYISNENRKVADNMTGKQFQCYKHLLSAQHQAIMHLTPYQQEALLELTPLQYYCVTKILAIQQQSFSSTLIVSKPTTACSSSPFSCLATSTKVLPMPPAEKIDDPSIFQKLTAVQHYVSVQMQTAKHFQDDPEMFSSERSKTFFEQSFSVNNFIKYDTDENQKKEEDKLGNKVGHEGNENDKKTVSDSHEFDDQGLSERGMKDCVVDQNKSSHDEKGASSLILQYINLLTNLQNELSINYFNEKQRNELKNLNTLQRQALWQLMSAQQQAIGAMPSRPFSIYSNMTPHNMHSMAFSQMYTHFQTLRNLASLPSSKLAAHFHEKIVHTQKLVNLQSKPNTQVQHFECAPAMNQNVSSATTLMSKQCEEIQEIIKHVPRVEVIEVEKRTVKYVPKVTRRVVEQVVEVPSKDAKVLVPKAVPVDSPFVIPKFHDKEVPVIMSETLIPEICEDKHILEVPVARYKPVIVPVDVYVPKPVTFPIKATSQRQHIMAAKNVDTKTFQRLLYEMNPHLQELDMFNAQQSTLFSNLIQSSYEQSLKCGASQPQPVSAPIVTVEDVKKQGIKSDKPFAFSMGGFQERSIQEYFNFLMSKQSSPAAQMAETKVATNASEISSLQPI